MSDDLVEHLRNPNHAQAPTLAESMMKQAAARIEALEAERYQLIADLAERKGRALKAESRADAAESELSTLRARVREVVGRIIAIENKEYGGDYDEIDEAREIARQLMDEVK